MSGVEIIGLILGGLPVAISALEHYRDVLDPVKDYVRYDDTLKSLRIQLRMQQALFDGTMRRLLQDQLSDDQMKALFEPEPGVPAGKMLWGTDEIQEKVQRRLGTTYKTFMDVVVEMGKLMQRLMDKLDVDIDKKVGTTQTSKPLLTPCHSRNGTPTFPCHLCRHSGEVDGN